MDKFKYNNNYDNVLQCFKLKFDALPVYMHGNNIRSVIPSTWRNIRTEVLKNNKCECCICGAKAIDNYDKRNFHLHEEWEVDITNYILTLNGLDLICKKCHEISHILRIQTLIYNKELPKQYIFELFKHFAKVNKCDLDITIYSFFKFNYEFSSNDNNFKVHKPVENVWKYSLYDDIPLYEEIVSSLKKVGLFVEMNS